MNTANIRNFSIIAHIDHGKSTLADRFLELTRTIPSREMKEQVLDAMDLERERGITIKSHPIQMRYEHSDGQHYILNLLDTPGHVDFTYEVSRSLAACEGAILLVDAAQGVEAQTVSHAQMALGHDLTLIPVLNKIDLPTARVEEVTRQVVELIGCPTEDILQVSAKNGQGVTGLLSAVVERIPPPQDNTHKPLRALIFDSTFDSYRGAIPYVRVFDGFIEPGTVVQFMSNEGTHEVSEVGHFILRRMAADRLGSGDVGYLVAGVKDLTELNVGDTVTSRERRAGTPLPGYQQIKPMIFSGLYPADSEDYDRLRESIERLRLNDASLFYEPETSHALGFGFRCGFLGLLHMDVVRERLEREFGLDLIVTVPNVRYQIIEKNGDLIEIDNPTLVPPEGEIREIREPYVTGEIITPPEHMGDLMKLCQNRRGTLLNTQYFSQNRAQLKYDLPLAEILFDFYDKLKSLSRGYASFDYELTGFRMGNLRKVDILLGGEIVDALSLITTSEKTHQRGKELCRRLREVIPRQQFEVVIQAAVGTKVVARESIRPYRKQVTAKCYGGDITRKRKLREKQKAGKKRMKQIGKLEVPQKAFLALFEVDSR